MGMNNSVQYFIGIIYGFIESSFAGENTYPVLLCPLQHVEIELITVAV